MIWLRIIEKNHSLDFLTMFDRLLGINWNVPVWCMIYSSYLKPYKWQVFGEVMSLHKYKDITLILLTNVC